MIDTAVTARSGSADDGSVTGSGHRVSRHLDLSGVHSVVVGANFVVHLAVDESEQATIRTDDNIADLVDATVAGGQLRLGLKSGSSVGNATLSADVTVARLDQLITGAPANHPDIRAGGFDVDARGQRASQITGPVEVADLQVGASDASTLALSGHPKNLELSGSGAGQLRLADLKAQTVDAELSGASNADVTVSETLAAQASGSSRLDRRRCTTTAPPTSLTKTSPEPQ